MRPFQKLLVNEVRTIKRIVLCLLTCMIAIGILPISVLAQSPTVDDMLNNGNQEQDSEDATETEEQPAETDQEQTLDTSSSGMPSLMGSFIKLVFALAVVIGLIVLISKFIKKRNQFVNRGRVLENLGGISVGSNKTLQTIRIGERYFVIGVGDSIEMLTEITDEETIEQLQEEQPSSVNPIDFLKGDKHEDKKQHTSKANSWKDFHGLFQKELNQMKKGRKQVREMIKQKKDDRNA
ncbi:flagellar protein [Gracilibacillus halophilus YIM-C55.5]|uniref:Flagellar protein n=1 Tax=Gracilibacillus halophilus YIM-C55.5 TaxID=1308866 RepID=N4WQ18_9BACI|nr:flagellar biosynthetic protein FliO [Gracilibacillus halophilus]ENH98227.1 flagellar protein [Gracilibacillus halophilus YIM-C55.5]